MRQIHDAVSEIYPVFVECEGKGINVLPFETVESKALDRKTRDGTALDRISSNVGRENIWLDNLKSQLQGMKQKKVYFGCGTYHPISMQNLFRTSGFKASINTDFFDAAQRKTVDALMHAGWGLREKFLRKQHNEIAQAHRERDELFLRAKVQYSKRPPAHAMHI